MRRHDASWTSLIIGVTFSAIAIAYLSAAIAGRGLQVRWVPPILLIGLGLAGLVATILRLRPSAVSHAADPDAPATVD